MKEIMNKIDHSKNGGVMNIKEHFYISIYINNATN
jgi:hypothetical protein